MPNAKGHRTRKKPLADKPYPERVRRAREQSERVLTREERAEREAAEWKAAQLAKAPPLTEEQQEELRRVLIPRRLEKPA